MTLDQILTHVLAFLTGGGGVYVLMRHVAGYLAPFEAQMRADFAAMKQELASRQAPPAPTPPPAPNAPGGA